MPPRPHPDPVALLGILTATALQAGRLHQTADAWTWSRQTRTHTLLPKVRTLSEWTDPKGRTLRQELHLAGRLATRTVWTWDGDTPASKETFDPSGHLLSRSRFRPTHDGLVETVLKPDNTVAFILLRRHDPSGRTTELLTFDPSSNLITRRMFRYDPSGALLSSSVHDDHNRTLLVSVYSYPLAPQGRMVRDETVFYADTSHPKERVTFTAVDAPLPPRPSSPPSPTPPLRPDLQACFGLGRHAQGPGARILTEALRRLRQGTRFQDSCYAWVESVYEAAGFPKQRRTTVWSSPESGPYADPLLLRPGDWIMFKNQTYGDVGHSGIFLAWLDLESRSALVVSYAGERRVQAGRFREYDISRTFRIVRAAP